jgi:hypothetical protein
MSPHTDQPHKQPQVVTRMLPRDMKKCSGYRSLKPNRMKIHSTENDPRSTKSPLNSCGSLRKFHLTKTCLLITCLSILSSTYELLFSFGVEWNRVHCYLGHVLACCTSPGWWWAWSNPWNAWQGKLKYSGKTCPSAASSTISPTWRDLGWAVGSLQLTVGATAWL